MHRCRIIFTALALLTMITFAPSIASASQEIGPNRVHFSQTGHYLSYAFLDYWRHHGDFSLLGYPVTEEMTEADTGLTVQYFERAVLEYHADAPPGWSVQLRRIGADLTAKRAAESPFVRMQPAAEATATYFPETGHYLNYGFRAYWEQKGGMAVFGYPISEEFTENGLDVQYFERARLEWHPENQGTPAEIMLGLLGSSAADAANVNRAPVERDSTVPEYNPALWKAPAPPTPDGRTTPLPGSPSDHAKWIEVDLSQQYLRAWEYGTLVFGEYISSGTAAHPTPTGMFSVYSKTKSAPMSGPGYYLPNVPNIMWFRTGGYSIHGTYWHHNFGHPMSHGCINVSLSGAAWLYNWTPVGTPVWIHW